MKKEKGGNKEINDRLNGDDFSRFCFHHCSRRRERFPGLLEEIKLYLTGSTRMGHKSIPDLPYIFEQPLIMETSSSI